MTKENIRLSLVITAKSKDDPKLADLLRSIEAQDFPKDQMEVLVITEGTSESAKAIGIKKAKGEVIGILASDNELINENTLSQHYLYADLYGASYPERYYYDETDNVLNRYFALFGCNDPLAFYLGKTDRISYLHAWTALPKYAVGKTTGDNGFFVKKKLIEKTDLDNYYHVDNSQEIGTIFPTSYKIRHNTGGNIFKFFLKRYRYGLEHAFNPNRRWHLVDFRKPKDIARLIWFIAATLTVVQPLYLSFRGFIKIRDWAWFLHLPVCMLTLITYGILSLHLVLRSMRRWLSVPLTARIA